MMALKADSSKMWLDLGYELFSEEGHEGLQVERLSRILGKNKSGFYHFFRSKEIYLEKLMQMHVEKEETLIPKFTGLPEISGRFLDLLVDNKQTILFQTHLVKNRDTKLFQDTYFQVNRMIEMAVQPIWVKYLGVSDEVAMKYWGIIRDTFYARVTSKTFNQVWLSEFMNEAKSILRNAQNDSASA